MLTIERDTLTKEETVTVATIETNFPQIVAARDLITDFHEMIRRKAEGRLDGWLNAAQGSMLSSFARGIIKDIAAVRAASIGCAFRRLRPVVPAHRDQCDGGA